MSMIDWHLKSIQDAQEKLRNEFNALTLENERLKQSIGRLEPYEDLPTSKRCYDPTKAIDAARWEGDYRTSLEIAKRNSEALKRNQQLLTTICTLISGTGIDCSRREWKRGKLKTESAEWKAIILQAMPYPPKSEADLIRQNEEFQKKKAEHEQKLRQHEAQQKRDQEAAEESRKRIIRTIEIAKSLGMAADSDIDDVKDEIRKRDKYLDLAIGGMKTRGDWSDGPWAAREALERFTPENDDDHAIVRNWQDQLSDFDDGRQFRDCTWNYDRLMEKASPEMVAAWNSLNE